MNTNDKAIDSFFSQPYSLFGNNSEIETFCAGHFITDESADHMGITHEELINAGFKQQRVGND